MNTKVKHTLIGLSAIGLAVLPAVAQDHSHRHEERQDQQPEQKETMVHAKVNSINSETRTINISHGAVKDLNWPAMTMDMKVAPDIDLDVLSEGQDVMVAIKRGQDNIYMISKLMLHGG